MPSLLFSSECVYFTVDVDLGKLGGFAILSMLRSTLPHLFSSYSVYLGVLFAFLRAALAKTRLLPSFGRMCPPLATPSIAELLGACDGRRCRANAHCPSVHATRVDTVGGSERKGVCGGGFPRGLDQDPPMARLEKTKPKRISPSAPF